MEQLEISTISTMENDRIMPADIKCVKCLQKHLALCRSFAREVLDGHGEGAYPDHRIDIEGELANAESHASVIDSEFTTKIRHLRRKLQKVRFMPDEETMDILNTLYLYSDSFSSLDVPDDIRDKYNALESTDIVSNILSSIAKQGCGCQNK